MSLNFEKTDKPIFIQLAELLEDGILNGVFLEESQIPSVAEISAVYKINPATANRSVSLLFDAGVVYKKRGIGMFVAAGAKEKIKKSRTRTFYSSYIVPLCEESVKLAMDENQIVELVKEYFKGDKKGGV